MAVKEETIEVEGEVVEALPSTMLRVQLEGGRTVLTTTSGTMRKHSIRILPGDRVEIELSPYDPSPRPPDRTDTDESSPIRQAHV